MINLLTRSQVCFHPTDGCHHCPVRQNCQAFRYFCSLYWPLWDHYCKSLLLLCFGIRQVGLHRRLSIDLSSLAGSQQLILCFANLNVCNSVIGFAAIGADFYTYYPTNTSKWATFFTTWSGTWLSLIFCNIVGIGIATAVSGIPAWSNAYDISSGALLLECYDGLGGFGKFLVVILALGSVTNNAPCSYAAALTIQVLGRYAKATPRWLWCVAITIVELALSVAGRNHLFAVFENFLPIMSYWVCPWLTIVVEEHLLFHKLRGVPFDWSAWEDKKRLPIGAAALFAWLVGWAGAIIGMYQVWYAGPVALKIGDYGGDIGAWLAIAFAGVVYPPLRYLELKKFGR